MFELFSNAWGFICQPNSSLSKHFLGTLGPLAQVFALGVACVMGASTPTPIAAEDGMQPPSEPYQILNQQKPSKPKRLDTHSIHVLLRNVAEIG